MASADCFVCIFPNKEIRDSILIEGPWFVAGQLIALDRWTEDFNPKFHHGFSSPTWIRLPHLPLQFWDTTNLSRIASMIGFPLWVDDVTLNWGRSEYARICVRLAFSSKLPNGIWIEGGSRRFFQPIVYEGLSQICFKCGVAGHCDNNCPQKPTSIHPIVNAPIAKESLEARSSMTMNQDPHASKPHPCQGSTSSVAPVPSPSIPASNAETPSSTSLNSSAHSNSDPGYGPWIMVTRRKPDGKNKQQGGPSILGKPAQGTSNPHNQQRNYFKPSIAPNMRYVPINRSGQNRPSSSFKTHVQPTVFKGSTSTRFGSKSMINPNTSSSPASNSLDNSSKIVFSSPAIKGMTSDNRATNLAKVGKATPLIPRLGKEIVFEDLVTNVSKKKRKQCIVIDSDGGDASPLVPNV